MNSSIIRSNTSLLTVLFLLIVLFAHHSAYTQAILSLPDLILELLSTFAVGGFFFLSGYKLSLSKTKSSPSVFFLNRLGRIHSLYVLAVMLFSTLIQPETSLKNVMLHLFGLQIVFPHLFGDNLLTLYFIGILYIYYSVFAITKDHLSSLSKFVLLNLLIFASLFIIHIIKPFGIQLIEHRFFRYYPYFISDMILAEYSKYWLSRAGQRIALIMVIGLCMLNGLMMVINNLPYGLYERLIYLLVLVNPVYLSLYLLLLKNLRIPLRHQGPINSLAYASFAIYLFHRPIWNFLNRIYHQETQLHQFYIVIVGTVLIFLFSFSIQSIYNQLTRSVTSTYIKKPAYEKIRQ